MIPGVHYPACNVCPLTPWFVAVWIVGGLCLFGVMYCLFVVIPRLRGK